MENSRQNKAKRNYANSQIKARNDKLRRAADIAPLRKGDDGLEKIANSPRVMTAAEYVANGDSVAIHVDACREPYLLVRDDYNEGEFLFAAIYDMVIKQEARSGLIELDLHSGSVLVKADTLVYWK